MKIYMSLVNKNIFLQFLFWLLLIFSVIAQISDQLIMWLIPNTVSIWDERLWFTLVPVLVNSLLFIFIYKKVKLFISHLSLTLNTSLVLYYFYYQFVWDVGGWKIF
jgi:hypothetical protein